MGLTSRSTGAGVLKELFKVELESPDDIVVALAGNPNTGKSTVFNSLTGLNQHTGNWPGKTVTNAQGKYTHEGSRYVLIDLPGTYSLFANSAEEQVARDFICFGKPHATVVVADATCLERNLNLVLQIMEITGRVVVCVNLMDEAKRKKIDIDLRMLENLLGVPVVGTSARSGKGLEELKRAVAGVAKGVKHPMPPVVTYSRELETAILPVQQRISELAPDKIDARWAALRLLDGDDALLKSMSEYLDYDLSADPTLLDRLEIARAGIGRPGIDSLGDSIVSSIVEKAESIAAKAVVQSNRQHNELDRKIDHIVTSKIFGIPIMLALLGLIFYITIKGANAPSELLANLFFRLEERLRMLFMQWNAPAWLGGLLIDGVYRTLTWVVSVMLPPMAIFFPLFTLLEDLGYLPRVAFNLDHFFKKACAHGKQALTMSMVHIWMRFYAMNSLVRLFPANRK